MEMETELNEQELIEQTGAKAVQTLEREDAPAPEPEPKVPAEPVKAEVQPTDWRNDDKVPEWLRKMDEKTLAALEKGETIPKHRFDEVLTRTKAFESLGTPEEIQAKLARLNAPPAEPAPVVSAKAEELPKEDQEMREYTLKLHPELREFPKLLEKMVAVEKFMAEQKQAAEMQKQVEAERKKAEWYDNLKKGDEVMKGLLTEAKINIKDQLDFETHRDGILKRLEKNTAVADKFYYEKDHSVLKSAFEDYIKGFLNGLTRDAKAEILRDKNNQAKLPKPPASGTGPTEPPEKPADSLAEAGDRAWDRFH